MPSKEKEEYSVPCTEAAQEIGVSAKTLQNWVNDGKVSAKRIGPGENRRYFFRPADVKRLAGGEIVNPELSGV